MRYPGSIALARRPLVLFTCALGGGILLRHGLGPGALPLALALAGTWLLRSRPAPLWGVAAAGILCGVLRGGAAAPPPPAPLPAEMPHLVRLAGRVAGPPRLVGRDVLLFTLHTARGLVPLSWEEREGRLLCRGCRVSLTGLALSLPPASPRGAPGWKVKTRGANLVVRSAPPWWYPPALLDRSRLHLQERLLAGVEEPAALALALCLLLGDGSRLDPWDQLRFRHTGTGHLLVVSGLHVALLGGLLLAATGGRGRAWAAGVVCLYALLAGGRPPALRAALGFSAWALAPRFGRRRDLASALAFSALPVLLVEPDRLLGPSFQVSYGAVAAMGLLGAPYEKRLTRAGLPPQGARVLAWSAAATLGTAPLALHHFGVFSPWSLLLTPLLTPFLALEVILAGLAPWLPGAVGPLLALLHRLQLGLLALVDRLPATPLFPLAWPGPLLPLLAAAAGLLLLTSRSARVRTAAFLLPCLPHFLPLPPPGNGAGGTLLDAGHGQCLLLDLPGTGVVVHDAGSLWRPRRLAREFREEMARRGRRRIAALCLSHADRDHFSALPLILASFPVERIFLPRQPQAAALARRLVGHGCRIRWVEQRWRLPLGPGLQLLAPGRAGQEKNEGCLVLHLVRPDLSLLSPGDLSGPGLDRLIALARAGALRADLLVAPHHGAATGHEERLVRALQAGKVLVSRAWRSGPPPGGPAYRRAGAEVKWTARCGSIEIGP